MPPFAGTREEREILADYLTLGLVHNVPQVKAPLVQQDVEPYPYNPEGEYVLSAWAMDGMSFTSNPATSGLDFSPGLPIIRAQLIRRGEVPELLSTGVTIFYSFQTNGKEVTGAMETSVAFRKPRAACPSSSNSPLSGRS